MLTSIMTRSAIVVLLCSLSIPAHALADNTVKHSINIAAQDLSSALEELSHQSGTDLVYRPEQVRGLKTHGAVGEMSTQDAVVKLLEGTRLKVSEDASGALLIAAPLSMPATSTTSEPGQLSPPAQSPDRSSLQLAQATPGQAPGDVSVEKQDEQTSKKKFIQLEEVVVTGSRLTRKSQEGAQEVRTYSSEQIAQGGQTTVADFLNTLPDVSLAATENGAKTVAGATTVSLHGLPFGTTLVLINGHRLETSGFNQAGDFFDLNNIPLAAVDRIEVVSAGSSAVYGSDAIAGVVNIILRKDIDDLETSLKYGSASDLVEWNGSVAWGKRWDRGSFSVVGGYQTRNDLTVDDRALTASNNYTAYGGQDNNGNTCKRGNVYSADGVTPLPGLGTATYAAVPAGFLGMPSIQEFAATAGTLNECSYSAGSSIIPATQRTGILAQGGFSITPSVEFFAEAIYSRVLQYQSIGYPELFGQPGFQQFTVSASNPFNPFGTVVGISEFVANIPQRATNDTTFTRPLVGLRGSFLDNWRWEFTAFRSEDSAHLRYANFIVDNNGLQNALNSSNRLTALNPFIDGPLGPTALLQPYFSDQLSTALGREQTLSGYLRGDVPALPAGPVEVAVGAEYTRDLLRSTQSFGGPSVTNEFDRRSSAAFAEAHIPLLRDSGGTRNEDTLAATVAGRFDQYSDFGHTTTPQFAVEWRPFHTLLFRSTYAKSFKAPPLFDLYFAQVSAPVLVRDPTTGQLVRVTQLSGGNPSLAPETGSSHTAGFVWSSTAIPDLRVSGTQWRVTEKNAIETLSARLIVANEDLFPGRVIRNGSGTITEVNTTFANFGSIDVEGVDYRIDYHYQTRLGDFSPSINLTQTYRYREAYVPGSPPVDGTSVALDSLNWAPRYKGALALGWTRGPYSAALNGRYVGRYQDYDSTQIIGNFWLFDVNARCNVGQSLLGSSPALKGLYVVFGGANLFDRQPQYSNYQFGAYGYDATQADIRGRYLYVQVGGKW